MIKSCLTTAGRLAFLQGRIQPEHVFKLALYTDKADFNEDTAVYTPINEVVGQGYVHKVLPKPTFYKSIDIAIMDFPGELVWENSTISAAGCMIFDASLGNLAIAVGSFGSVITSTNDKFTLESSAGLIRFI